MVKHSIWWRNNTSRVDWSSFYAPYLELWSDHLIWKGDSHFQDPANTWVCLPPALHCLKIAKIKLFKFVLTDFSWRPFCIPDCNWLIHEPVCLKHYIVWKLPKWTFSSLCRQIFHDSHFVSQTAMGKYRLGCSVTKCF